MRWLPAPERDGATFSAVRRLRFAALALLIAMTAVGLVPSPGAAAQQEIYSNGCYYIYNGNVNTGARCPQSDGSDFYFQSDGRGGLTFLAQCAYLSGFVACLFASGLYVETYGDGSKYLEGRNRTYEIYHKDGSLAEMGAYNANGIQVPTWWSPRTGGSQAILRRSQTYWANYGAVTNGIRLTNPTWFDSVVAGTSSANVYMNCLWVNDSQDDFDGDRRIGFNELVEYCAN